MRGDVQWEKIYKIRMPEVCLKINCDGRRCILRSGQLINGLEF
jgi:hypothetical protein